MRWNFSTKALKSARIFKEVTSATLWFNSTARILVSSRKKYEARKIMAESDVMRIRDMIEMSLERIFNVEKKCFIFIDPPQYTASTDQLNHQYRISRKIKTANTTENATTIANMIFFPMNDFPDAESPAMTAAILFFFVP
jgi:hypothetical protein